MSLNETLHGQEVFLPLNNFVGTFHSICVHAFLDSYEITYVNEKNNTYCKETLTGLYIAKLGTSGLVNHIMKHSKFFDTPLYRLTHG